MIKVEPCEYEAAKYAVMHWHYSKSMPSGKLVRFGVWEDGKFIGCVLFGRGGNNNLGKAYQLEQTEICELVRVALKEHQAPVTQIVATSIKKLKETNPGLTLVVSYADQNEGHLGIIYQAGNWIYDGQTATDKAYFDKKGRRYHSRVVSESGYKKQFGVYKKVPKPSELKSIDLKPKFRYLMPLNKRIRKQVLPLSKPYPKGSTSNEYSGV